MGSVSVGMAEGVDLTDKTIYLSGNTNLTLNDVLIDSPGIPIAVTDSSEITLSGKQLPSLRKFPRSGRLRRHTDN